MVARLRLGVVLGVFALGCAATARDAGPVQDQSFRHAEHVQDVSFPVKDTGPRAFQRTGPDTIELAGKLYRPEGRGPFPAVVLLHGCTGLGAGSTGLENVAGLLRSSGYVVLVVNSFSWRGVSNLCGNLGGSPTPSERVEDAMGASRYLSSLSFVDSTRIGLVGWSHGGITALETWARGSAAPGGAPFAAVAAYYPYCAGEDVGGARVPLLIIIGERDDWCPAALCQRLVAQAASQGRDAAVRTYPGATHAFDSVEGGKAIDFLGHRLTPDPAAAQDSRVLLLAFFGRTLKP
jgi:dienelactone hydrolase